MAQNKSFSWEDLQKEHKISNSDKNHKSTSNSFIQSKSKPNSDLKDEKVFLYPYNFVSSEFDKSVRESFEKGEYSGHIEIELQNTSPLLIAEKQIIENEEVKVQSKNIDGKYIVPASSFKGMLRNTIEIITNSCYSILDDRKEKEIQDFRLDFNKKKSLNNLEIYPGRIVEIDGELKLEKLKEAWINDKFLSNQDRKELDENNNPKKAIEMLVAENNGWSGKRNIPGINIVDTVYDKNQIKKPTTKKLGYIKDTGLNFSNTHHQRFFYEDSKKEYFDLEEKILSRYEEVLKRQEKENEDNYMDKGAKRKFKTTYHHKKARPGALVWGIFDKNRSKIISLSYVQTPKLAYYMIAKELLNELSPCEDLESLCYTCRMFGTVIKDTKVALQGKLKFEDLIIQNEPNVMSKNIRMDILDSPRPSNSNFYVNKNNNSYDDIGATIRGRKIFWHHKDKQDIHDQNQLEMSNIINRNASDSQSSLIRPLLSGNNFKGKIQFNNLTASELGALMYALGQERTLHKIGAGKPLGMGSIKITKKDLYLENKEKKYSAFETSFNCQEFDTFITQYKNDIKNKIGQSFENIKFIKEYIKYSECMMDFSKENYPTFSGGTGNNTLEWFMANKNLKLPNIQDYK